MNLQPRALACFVSGQPFSEGDRVMSLLVRTETGQIARFDALEANAGSLAPDGFVACSWVQVFKPRPAEENAERALKLTADTLFQALADPSSEPTPETARLVRFLALRLVGPGEEDPDRDVSGLYCRVIPVLQYLDPADHAVRKDRPDVLLDTGGPGLRHVILLTC